MTIAIIINAVLAGAVLAAVLAFKVWAIRTQHHDVIGAAEHRLRAELQAPAQRRSPAYAERDYERGQAAA